MYQWDCCVYKRRWPDVECALSTEFYELNARIGIAPQSGASSSIKEIIVPAPKDVLFDSERQEVWQKLSWCYELINQG